MKTLLKLLFGNVGLLIWSVVAAIASWFLFPMFINFVMGVNTLSNIVGWVLCPFAIGFLLSSVISSLSLFFKGITSRQWLWIIVGIIVFTFDILIVILAFK